jgi:hypothetical protein
VSTGAVTVAVTAAAAVTAATAAAAAAAAAGCFFALGGGVFGPSSARDLPGQAAGAQVPSATQQRRNTTPPATPQRCNAVSTAGSNAATGARAPQAAGRRARDHGWLDHHLRRRCPRPRPHRRRCVRVGARRQQPHHRRPLASLGRHGQLTRRLLLPRCFSSLLLLRRRRRRRARRRQWAPPLEHNGA